MSVHTRKHSARAELLWYLPPVFQYFLGNDARYSLSRPYVTKDEIVVTNGFVCIRVPTVPISAIAPPGLVGTAIEECELDTQTFAPYETLPWSRDKYRTDPLAKPNATVPSLLGGETEINERRLITRNDAPVFFRAAPVALRSWVVAPFLDAGFSLYPSDEKPRTKPVLAELDEISALLMPMSPGHYRGIFLDVDQGGGVELREFDEAQRSNWMMFEIDEEVSS